MFPHPSGAMTPVAPITTKPLENHNIDGLIPPACSGSDGAPVKSPEPHWDAVIGAATD